MPEVINSFFREGESVPDITAMPEGTAAILQPSRQFGEYDGRALFKLEGTVYFIEVEDHGWEPVDDPSPFFDSLKEPTGEDRLVTRIANIATGQLVELEETIPDGDIPGLLYAAEWVADTGEDDDDKDHYRNYMTWRIKEIFRT
jgi:hypothetical protein